MTHDYSILTKRLLIRPLLYKDLECVRQWRNKAEIRKWFFHDEVVSEEKHKEWFDNYLNKENDLCFIVEDLGDINQAIGMVSLYNLNESTGEGEFGRFMIGHDEARGKGYGFEIAIGICDFAKSILHLKTIYLDVYTDNKAARHIYEKVGFKPVAYEDIQGRRSCRMTLES